ncbi:MAG: (2Fe-2S) ferredoxin domain-containing protein [Hydrococcus sp. Prado102]|jgi:(2Fe-2S) ferredoxin|nr:(2Fe-2S) ferredoxin domain-containing protein [Hydrococcus sp. Prado102]
MSYQKQKLEFNLVGQLLSFVIKDSYKIKYLRIIDSGREYWIKPDKEIRDRLDKTLTPGCWVDIRGTKKQCFKTGKLILKAYSIERVNLPEPADVPISFPQSPPLKRQAAKASILVCQKPSCWKRGGKAVCQALAENLRDRGLDDKVQIKLTGCLKQCKHGPNMVVMPDKARYCRVEPGQAIELIEKHFECASVAQELPVTVS